MGSLTMPLQAARTTVHGSRGDHRRRETVQRESRLQAVSVDPRQAVSNAVDLPADDLPVAVTMDTTLRVKVIDSCGFSCTFCHNEGTPVTLDNRRRRVGDYVARGASGRVSIYTPTNGATFLASPVPPDTGFRDALRRLCASLNLSEVHLTGGEPTLHPNLDLLVGMAADEGLKVSMTSNGERGHRVMAACAAAGLDRVNFSVFGTTGQELSEVQGQRLARPSLAQHKLDALQRSIAECQTHGVAARANIVVADDTHAERVRRLLDEYSPALSVRLLNSLDHGQVSIDAIEALLAARGAVAEEHRLVAGASGWRTAYRLAGGRRVWFKRIRPVRLPSTCEDCAMNSPNDCQEGFYGVRLYRDQKGDYQVGVCIRRMDLCMPIDDFLEGHLPGEILALRRLEYDHLTRGRAEPQVATD